MAITTAMTNRARQDFLSGVHLPSHTYKIGLFKATVTGTYGTGTQFYSDVSGDEHVAGGGNNYVAGGNILSSTAYAITAGTGSIDWADSTWATATISSIGAFVYNATVTGSNVLGVFDFGGTVSSTSGTYTVTIPGAGTGVLRIS